MARLRLSGWMLASGAAAVVLLRDLSWSAVDPAVTVMIVVRGVAGLLAAYLFVATVAALVTLGRLRVPAPAVVRRLVAAALGSGMLVAPLGAPVSAWSVSSASSSASAPQRPTGDEPPVLRRISEPEPAAPPASPAPVPAGRADEVVVAAGDHLWGIAARTVQARLGRAATDGEIAPYWSALIDANRDRLATGDPDLIFEGQRFVLPPQ